RSGTPATAGQRSSGTASSARTPTTKPSTSPTAPEPYTQPHNPPAALGCGRVPCLLVEHGLPAKEHHGRAGAGGDGNGTAALVEDRGRPQRLRVWPGRGE